MKNTIISLEQKKAQLDAHKPLSPDLVTNLQNWFKIELTYTSNAIEGNTLSRAETALVVEKNLTVEGKTIQEHQEAINHAQVFNWIIQKVNSKKQKITESTVLDIHQLILQKINHANAGRYRNIPVRIAGSTVIMPNPAKVPQLMSKFINWLKQRNNHPLTTAIDAHFKLVSIHPFIDGNGRTARLLMNLLLMQAGYPPAIIRKEDRRRYINSIEKAQLGGSLSDYYQLMYKAVNRSLDIYLSTLNNKDEQKSFTQKPLLKIGEIAKLTSETISTIRHWTKEGLLTVVKHTPGGYQLYNQKTALVVKKIRQLQNNKRLTIAEIKDKLQKPNGY
jgi:Fic family protein